MGFEDFDWANIDKPRPNAKLTPEHEARQLDRLRYLPYVILKRQLEIKVLQAEVAADLARKKELEAKYGEQPRSTWALAHIIEAAEKVTDPREAWILMGQLHEAHRVAEEKQRRREKDRDRKAAARKRGD